MKINSIRIKNFYSVENLELKFDEFTGITLIEGRNLDSGGSNGTGKSIIIEAIVFALTGRTIRKSTEDDLVNNLKKKACEVEITVNDNVTIARGKRPTYLKFFIDGIEYTKDNKWNTQDLIEETLNISYKTFLSSSVFGQENTTHFISATSEDKRGIIQKFLNLSWLSDCREKIKFQKSECNQGIKAKQAIIDNNLRKVKELEDKLKSISTKKYIELPYTYSELEAKWVAFDNYVKNRKALENTKKKYLDELEGIFKRKKQVESNICPTCEQKLKNDKVANELLDEESIIVASLAEINQAIIHLNSCTVDQPAYTLSVFRAIEEKNSSLGDIGKYKEMIASYLEDNNTQEQDKVLLNRQYDIMRFWEKAFSETGLVKYVIRNILTFFNQKVNFYLSYLSNNKIKIFFNDMLEEEISVNKSKVSYVSLSGGEKRKVSLATMLGLQSLLSITNKDESDLIFFDEVAENLDDEGIDGLYILLSELKKTKKVFVITHNTQLKSLLHENKVITLVKKNGKTKLEK